jgi:hypothetical protein
MVTLFALLALLAAPQLDPALTPHRALKPALPKIDENVCPFEGCQLGAWRAISAVQLFSSWKEDRKPVTTLSKGEAVTAITGVHITFVPSEMQVTALIPDYGLRPGDTIYGYVYKGEGVFSAWFNGYWVEDFDGSGVTGAGCNRNCNAKLVKQGHIEWWVEMRTQDGTIGWTKDTDSFDGKDALSGSD